MKPVIRILLTVAVLAAGIGCGPVAKHVALHNPKVEHILAPPELDRTLTHTGTVEIIGEGDYQITVLYVAGTWYEMGFEQGRLLAPQVRATIQDVEGGALKLLPKVMRDTGLLTEREKRDIVDTLLDKAWEKMEPFTPREDMEEMAGLAAGSGVPLKTIHRMHAIPDVGETSCSALVAKGSATRDGHVYQLRILDYGANLCLQIRPLVTICR